MEKPLVSLMQREMNRKEFLTTLGFALASIMGFSTIIHMLTGKSVQSYLHGNTPMGYGSSPYGGGKE
jgi:hypothetical protein